MKLRLKGTLCGLLVCLMSALAQAGEAPTTRLRAAYSTIAAGHSVLWVTRDAGIFEKQGLDVEMLFIQSSSLMAQALLARTIHFFDARFVQELDRSGFIDGLYN
jgi:ABC-type nitrate/sulfonate/bicarbonate transport system substrate-binding protein